MKTGLAIKINKTNNYNEANLEKYQWVIGKLIYLVCKTKLNTAFIIKKLNKYNINSWKCYFWVAKQVVHYLKKTIYLELVYKQCLDKNFLILPILYNFIRYSDNHFARDLKNQKSVIEYRFFIIRAVRL